MSMESKGYKDPAKYEAYLERQREYKRRKRVEGDPWYDPEKVRAKNLQKMYGISHEEYEKMWEEQEGLCKICGNPESVKLKGVVKLLAVDHCHSSGKVRGLLCNNCNRAIGMLKDDPEILRRAASYLEEM